MLSVILLLFGNIKVENSVGLNFSEMVLHSKY
jgi:hypothetical protein